MKRKFVQIAALCLSAALLLAAGGGVASAAPAAPMTINLHQPLSGIEYDAAMLILSEENMNQVRTAERLGISRTTLWRLLRRGPAEKQQEETAPEKPEHK